jgi:hypothetical protein
VTWEDDARLLNMRISGWTARAFTYLEAHGFRFLVDFGTDNAIAKARAHWTARKRRRR